MRLSTADALKRLKPGAGGYRCLEGELLRRYQALLLEMARDAIEVCEREGIAYQLGGGSALGAVRHGGFIPWDDDIDINLPGDDYERFRARLLREHGDRYCVLDANTPGYCKPFARIGRRGSLYRGCDAGGGDRIFIDVIRMENLPDSRVLRFLHGSLCMAAGFLLSCRAFFAHRRERMRIARANPELAGVFRFKIAVGALLSFLPLRLCVRFTWRCYALCGNGDSAFVGFPAGRKHYFGEIHRREDMVNAVRMPFEGYLWRVARDYDGYLRKLYGPDYMALPPDDAREHHYYRELRFPGDE